ncbi:MAG: geranylgeranyl reductase family protein [Aquificaceae bacterium]
MKYQVVVVGGGPAGAFVSYNLSKLGFKVALLEKEALPRFKLCAGCLSARTLKLLPEGYEALILNTIKGGRLGYKGLEDYYVPAGTEVAYIVDRKDFDYFLVEKSVKAGTELIQAEFLGFEREKEAYKVYTSKGSLRAEFLIGADGAHSRVARLLGYRPKGFKSLEFFTEGDLKQEVIIEIGWVERGYLWAFPHRRDGISVGVATTGQENLLKILKEYCLLKGIKYKHPKGWHIPFSEEGPFLGRGRVLLLGDAAGMTDPLLGEGIYYALWAGKLLSQALLENPNEPTKAYKELLKPLTEELKKAKKIGDIAYKFQRVAYRMGKDYALKSFFKVLTGEKSYGELYWKGWFSFLKHGLYGLFYNRKA